MLAMFLLTQMYAEQGDESDGPRYEYKKLMMRALADVRILPPNAMVLAAWPGKG